MGDSPPLDGTADWREVHDDPLRQRPECPEAPSPCHRSELLRPPAISRSFTHPGGRHVSSRILRPKSSENAPWPAGDRYLVMPSAALGSFSIASDDTPKLSSRSLAGFEASHCESEISS